MNIHSVVVEASIGEGKRSKRDVILEAALELFVEWGFHGTSVPAIATRARVGAGTIYRYFDSKERIVNALYQQQKRAIGAHVLEDFPHNAPPREQFHSFWVRMTGYAMEHPRGFAFLELHHHGSYLDDTSHALESQLIEFASSFVRHAQGLGEIKQAEPMVLMSMVYGAIVGLMRAQWEGRVDLDDAALTVAEDSVWAAIRA